MVLKNLLAAEPDGPVWPVNPRYDHIGPYPSSGTKGSEATSR